ncbi:diguanylate cyclase [Planktothricoides sp. FACHB-1370]|uniref:Diguanylate cyclase n=1 Tax=Planktothricoides raciborskii FACHB-1370 TaxID=2949576 RepID=A0ABR8EFH7_9CYAN|nr:diguanylate cyclase [Planktothricoides raciborskii FACHB-1370]MBD2584441.1 diguanylate cyclase [Planktothricoides raciborskii FACHB-1261]
MVMIDVDHFKKFNDTFGHKTGNMVLQKLGIFLQ